MMIRNKKLLRVIAIFFAGNMLLDTFFPIAVQALTSGPQQPEFTSFEPVATTDMVNLFSGDFTYNLPVLNVPGPDGSGYALSLSYHSGATAEEEAGWVGFGWTLNPGAINRSKRGFPDDFNGKPITFFNKVKPNWTMSVKTQGNMEISSNNPSSDNSPLKGSLSLGIRYNSYRGMSKFGSFGLSDDKGINNLNISLDGNNTSLTYRIDPNAILKTYWESTKAAERHQIRQIIRNMKRRAKMSLKADKVKGNLDEWIRVHQKTTMITTNREAYDIFSNSGYGYAMTNPALVVKPVSFQAYKGFGASLHVTGEATMVGPVGWESGATASFSYQENIKTTSKKAYGYMYNPGVATTSDGSDKMADYYVEKSTPFTKRDHFIGMPFNNADYFSMTGEGLSGGFRYYQHNVGTFYPNHTKSNFNNYHVGLELAGGQTLEVGFKLGFGHNTSVVDNWKKTGNTDDYTFDNNGTFRFSNDMGGNLTFGNTNEIAAKVENAQSVSVPGAKSFEPMVPASLPYSRNTDLDGATSFIQTRQSADGKIDGFEIWNGQGVRYLYDQPVYARDEYDLNFGIKKENVPDDLYLAYQDVAITDDAAEETINKGINVMGQHVAEPYAVNYLLSEITTPDYVDANGNNESDGNDFGGWTRFHYRQAVTDYRFRVPYTGLQYRQNSMVDKEDDMGSVYTGLKNIHYLKSVETKTHIAFFITNNTIADVDFQDLVPDATVRNSMGLDGSGDPRPDGIEAAFDANNDNIDDAAQDPAQSPTKMGTKQMEKLERIVLYAKARLDKPVSTVNFQYSNKLVKNLPNSLYGPNSTTPDQANSGKLTLEKVWFEYEGLKRTRTNPYIFKYRYKPKQDFAPEVRSQYDEILGTAGDWPVYSDVAQNPPYSQHSLDAWGNYQYFKEGEERHENMQEWLNQGEQDPEFDPAAWQLKQIILPSGGEILVEYEQKSYAYVQDRVPMAMVSLNSYMDTYNLGNSYQLNLADLGIDPDAPGGTADVVKLHALCHQHFIEDGERVYFKFLYALKGNNPKLDDCRTEYISGYTHVNDVELSADHKRIYFHLGKGDGASGKFDVPRQLCFDFIRGYAGKKIDGASCEDPFDEVKEAIDEINDTGSLPFIGDPSVVSIGNKTLIPLMKKMGNMVNTFDIPIKATLCRKLNKDLSYLKVPMHKAKRGGGLRVKRLLMYDSGLETGDAALYGSSYHYERLGQSSGVATNEPSSIREENALVSFLDRHKQSYVNAILFGRDKKQFEGPLGESLLPAPSVGHEQVIVKGIYKGKTGTGYTVNEYHTVRTYPFDRVFDHDGGGNAIQYTSLNDKTYKQRDRMWIPAVLINYKVDKNWVSQGFRFMINKMHGQPKKVASYGYEDQNSTLTPYLAASREYEYFEPGEKIPLFDPEDNSITHEHLGKEMDVSMEMRKVSQKTFDFSIELDVNVMIQLPPIITISAGDFSLLFDQSSLHTHATTKVIKYPVVVKRVKNFQDGIWSETENLAFNELDGRPVMTRTKDGFHQLELLNSPSGHGGEFYSLNFPAAWAYPEMGQKSKDPTNANMLNQNAGAIVSYGDAGNMLDGNWFTNPTGVVTANAKTFKKDWNDADLLAAYGAPAATLTDIWRPSADYVYRSELIDANQSATGIYKGGVFSDPIAFFDWADLSQNDRLHWIKNNEVLKYSPHGHPIEERTIVGTHNAVRYGYDHTLPVITAQNAAYETISFQDFERSTVGSDFKAHSGKRSLHFNNHQSYSVVNGMVVNQQLYEQGALLSLWLNSHYPGDPIATNPDPQLHVLSTGGGSLNFPLTKVARSGEWQLYEGEIKKADWDDAGISVTDNLDLILDYNLEPGEQVFLDDIRFQPLDASTSAFVYDVATLRLVTQFDDQGFGLFFQYNDEGQLIRQLIETEKGLKTISESHVNIPNISD